MLDQPDSSKPAGKSVQRIGFASGPNVAKGAVLLDRCRWASSIPIEDQKTVWMIQDGLFRSHV
jgi:hypothetical protein